MSHLFGNYIYSSFGLNTIGFSPEQLLVLVLLFLCSPLLIGIGQIMILCWNGLLEEVSREQKSVKKDIKLITSENSHVNILDSSNKIITEDIC